VGTVGELAPQPARDRGAVRERVEVADEDERVRERGVAQDVGGEELGHLLAALAPPEPEVGGEEVDPDPADRNVRAQAAARLTPGHREIVGAGRVDGMT
jgi:hypothetical protein